MRLLTTSPQKHRATPSGRCDGRRQRQTVHLVFPRRPVTPTPPRLDDACCRWVVEAFRCAGTDQNGTLNLYRAFLDADLPAPQMRMGSPLMQARQLLYLQTCPAGWYMEGGTRGCCCRVPKPPSRAPRPVSRTRGWGPRKRLP